MLNDLLQGLAQSALLLLLHVLGGIVDVVNWTRRRGPSNSIDILPDPTVHRSLSTLAPEIWLEVFKHAPRSVIGTGEPKDMFALCVSQVCRTWRELAQGDPHLWASISWNPTGGDAASRFGPLWMLHLQRSGEAPLDVQMYSNEMHIGVDMFGELLEATLAHQRRFRSFVIICNTEDLASDRVYLLSSAPTLEYIDICVNQAVHAAQDHQNPGGSIMLDLSGCPVVKSLNIEGLALLHRDTGHLGSLEEAFLIHNPSLQGQDLTCSHLLSFLRSTPSLEELTVLVGVGNIFPPITPQISLPRLRNLFLDLSSGDVESPDGLFGSLDLPSLKHLDLSINVFDTFDREWHHASALRRLQSLKLRYAQNLGPAGNQEISSLLTFTPSLKSLHISAYWLSSMTMEQLTLRDWAFNLCPELESITLDADPYKKHKKTHFVEAGALIEMITSRWRHVNGDDANTRPRGLRRVQLRLPQIRDIREMEPVRSYMEEGLVVEMLS